MEAVGRLSALLALLLVGTGLRVTDLLDERRTDRLNDLAYYVALPALIFVSTYDRSVVDVVTLSLLVGLVVVLFSTAAVAWLVHRNRSSKPRRSVAIAQSYHSNLGYLGFPLVAATFDAQVTAVASVILGVLSLIQVPLTVFILFDITDSDASMRAELRRLLLNPVLLTLVLGLAVGSLELSVPASITRGLDLVGAFALPLALLCVGASLRVDRLSMDVNATAAVVGLKICCMPAIAWVVFSLLSVDPAAFVASVMMLGTPTAVSTFVFASELGGDAEFASLNVFMTTVASVGTLFVLIELLRFTV